MCKEMPMSWDTCLQALIYQLRGWKGTALQHPYSAVHFPFRCVWLHATLLHALEGKAFAVHGGRCEIRKLYILYGSLYPDPGVCKHMPTPYLVHL